MGCTKKSIFSFDMEDVVEILNQHIPELKGIYLFGSKADGTDHVNSDVDLAILTTYGNSPSQLTEIRVLLSSALSVDVDLVDLRQVPLDIRFIILTTGRRIYCNDITLCDHYEVTCFSMYQRFELERKAIVEDVKKRGFIYG